MLDVQDDRIEAGYLKAMDEAASGKGHITAPAKVGGLVTASPEPARLSAQRLAAAMDTCPKPNSSLPNPSFGRTIQTERLIVNSVCV